MAKKRIKKFGAVKALKSLARERVGMPPPTRTEPERKKKEKHKVTLERLLEREE